MNCKIEFIHHATQVNPWNTDTFAWIDFSIGYIFADPDNTFQKLVDISKRSCPGNTLAFAGCLDTIQEDAYIIEHVNWRFSGGFFIGHREMIHAFYVFYSIYYPIFLNKHKLILWEVNFWAWLEYVSPWKPIWYYGDHNETILDVPNHVFI